ncbi:hypothetical protein L3X38_031272 [Prunus dulcis]|uniref:NAC domain-containing protein n=1 Tax=Prunus dulcis TaxID=3755 RepID=A0AAD4VBW4_PRUDU|nr:hypothetical protein L3X38_031272 [Prunus dulcis]
MTQLLGFRFDPTDQEIIGFFLYKVVVANNPLTSMPPYNKVIYKCNLFGNKREPSEIWRDYGGDQLDDQDLYFVSELQRNGLRIQRKTGSCGTWSETETYQNVKDEVDEIIGRKRKFRYENGNTSEDHAGWLLDEYSLFEKGCKNRTSRNCYDFDVVICRLRRKCNMNESGKKRKCSSQDQSNKKMKRDQSTKEMKTENSVGPQIMNDESNQLMINDITTCDQDYLIDTNHKSFNIDELFVELDREPPLLHSQQLPQIVESQEKPLPTSCLCINQFDGALEAAASNLSNFEYNSELARSTWQHNVNADDHQDPNLIFTVDELLAEDAEPLSTYALDDVYNVVSQPLDQNSCWSKSFMDQTYNSYIYSSTEEEIIADS